MATAVPALLFLCNLILVTLAKDLGYGATAQAVDASELSLFREQLKLLGKQVTALIDNRREDVESIERHVTRTLAEDQAMAEVKKELNSVRLELRQLRPAQEAPLASPANAHLTLTWLQHTIGELKREMTEFQARLNGTRLLTMYETVDADLQLVKSDAKVTEREQRAEKEKRMRAEAEVKELKAELRAVEESNRAVGLLCSKVKNQLFHFCRNFRSRHTKKFEMNQLRTHRPSYLPSKDPWI